MYGLGSEVRGYKLKLGVLGYRLKVMCGVGIAIRGLNKLFIRIYRFECVDVNECLLGYRLKEFVFGIEGKLRMRMKVFKIYIERML